MRSPTISAIRWTPTPCGKSYANSACRRSSWHPLDFENAVVDAMVKNPILSERLIVVIDDQGCVSSPPEVVLEIL
ncbi:MAG: hypothetical protein VX733_09125 [Candidatus Latescibacterota bacterium]|nr:hypothetical protein [Candidatus Latescibacterota bacterium]